MHWAVSNDSKDCLELLREYGGDITATSNASDTGGRTLLHLAASDNCFVCLSLLCSWGVDVNAKNG